MPIPYLDLKRQYNSIKTEIDSVIQQTIDSCAFVAGEKVKEFEQAFAQYCGVKHTVGLSSGTSALYVCLRVLDIGPDDIVITVPFTFIATVEAITLTGAQPVFVDIDPATYNISVEMLKKYLDSCHYNAAKKILIDSKLNKKVRAIIPVHLYGLTAQMKEIMDLAGQYGLFVIEDAAQAHGGIYKGKKAGSIGHLGAFSFYPSKNLGAYGQGGAITTNDDSYYEKAKLLINHGQNGKYKYHIEGWNFKMDGIQAAILSTKLQHLDEWNNKRRQHADYYQRAIGKIKSLIMPVEPVDMKHVYHLYTIRAKKRDNFALFLDQAGIGTTIAYPVPLHLQNAYKELGYIKGAFPIAEKCANEVISLPIYPELTEGEIEFICTQVKKWEKQNA